MDSEALDTPPKNPGAADAPLVSIVIPTFNRATTLRRAVVSGLEQSYPAVEVIVSDNASTDGSIDTISDLMGDRRLRVLVSDTNRGPVSNWAKAVAASRGQYVKIVWSDDWIEQDTVECLVRPLVEDRSIGFTLCSQWIHHGNTATVSAPYQRTTIGARDVAQQTLHGIGLPVSPGAGLMKRQDVEWALAASTASSGASCADRAIGPDLLMLYAALRRGEAGRYVATTRVHFTASHDSISVNADPRDLSDCYNAARSYLVALCPDPAARVVMRQALALYRLRHRRFGAQSLGSPIDTTDASTIDWLTGSSATAAGIGRYLRDRARRSLPMRTR